MRRSPRARPPPPPPRTPPPVPAPSQAMAAPAAAGEGPDQEQEVEEEEFEIRNDGGFVYKVPRGRYPPAAPSSTQAAAAAAGPDPEIVALRRRRRALLRLIAKRRRQLSRLEALESEFLAPLPEPRPPASQSPPASPHPAAASASAPSASVLDELIAQADVQAELLKRVSEMCDQLNALCDEHEAAVVDEIAALPVWGNPRELLAAMCSPDPDDDEQADPGTSGLDEGIIGDKRIQSLSPCKRCSRFGCTGETCCETRAEVGDELPPPVLAESRKRKGAPSPSSSSTPGPTTRRKAASIQRADMFGSPGPTTRRRAAAQHVPPH